MVEFPRSGEPRNPARRSPPAAATMLRLDAALVGVLAGPSPPASTRAFGADLFPEGNGGDLIWRRKV
jgi:hypothetical protein